MELYYAPPTDKQFEELKAKAIEIWQTYDNTYGYVDEKVGRIRDLKNVNGNFMLMVSMFDIFNQAKLAKKLSKRTCAQVDKRVRQGGAPPEFNPFLMLKF